MRDLAVKNGGTLPAGRLMHFSAMQRRAASMSLLFGWWDDLMQASHVRQKTGPDVALALPRG